MHFDILIVGGGLVGAGFAAALGKTDLRIALIDAKPPSSNDGRLFALNEGSCQFLQNIHLWQQLKDHASAIKQVHISRKGCFGAVRLTHQDVGLPVLGYVVPASNIEAALNDSIGKQHNLTVYRPATLTRLEQHADQVLLEIQQDDQLTELTASIVVGADGAESTVREQAGIAASVTDYQQTAIVTRTQLKRSHDHIAYERFIHDGAIAMLPLLDNQCATIWSLPNAQAEALLEASDDVFLKKLQQQFGYRLGAITGLTQRFSYPLKLLRAKRNHHKQVFLLGNAAHTIHPIAAQGFNLAIYEVASIVGSIQAKLDAKQPVISDDFLSASQQIERQQSISINVSHKLAELFLTESTIKQSILQLGMVGLDAAQPVRKRFLSAVLGKSGSMPALLMDQSG